ncbi:type VII secretion-associated serine protease mycosin [Amycolatopsis cynarae]|uniref:Type VII secretion-associated serine protease mycosin n=1 Tax=Amycolatopsis cynarae TaxID=2995223 RepID=A0ABY7B678_9PSEU|nr:type VII secretion-associated serine protease mycosin [Amycolatopsis sp. HUAS 11-8]WAL67840.1 type VII secretion-associated serine protease mycosin [Amycolatopsis sp. HUAS 11-8]
MNRHRLASIATVLAVAALQLSLGGGTAHAAPPPGACTDAQPAHPEITAQPWAQQTLAPEAAWPYSRGAGVLVAVVDSGVDADHPQLRRPGKVLAGRDFAAGRTFPGNFDCDSHGTAVASIIAGDAQPGVGFHGVAPDATLLPVRVSDRDIGDRGETLRINPQVIGAGIRYAVDQGARVLNLSLAGLADYSPIRDAVAYAVARDVVVVAAAGNAQQDASTELPSYPAAYPGVLGVGAVDINGARASTSQIGPYVGLVAPGAGVLAATRVGGHAYVDGSSFATPFVAGTAALVRAAWPQLSAREVIRRLEATASPARGGQDSDAYGAGLVNPYRAVTDGMALAPAAGLPAYHPAPVDTAALAHTAWVHDTTSTATWLAVGGAGAMVLVALVFVVVPRGRRRGWQPGRAASVAAEPAGNEPPEQVSLLQRS